MIDLVQCFQIPTLVYRGSPGTFQWDTTSKTVHYPSLTLTQFCKFVHSWRPWYSTDLMKHYPW